MRQQMRWYQCQVQAQQSQMRRMVHFRNAMNQHWHPIDPPFGGQGVIPLGGQGVIPLLLASHADVNAVDRGGHTAFTIASQHGLVDNMTALLEDESINISLATTDGRTALILAATGGHQDAVEFLLLNGANIDASTTNGAIGKFFQCSPFC
jgi:hypothetical protein